MYEVLSTHANGAGEGKEIDSGFWDTSELASWVSLVAHVRGEEEGEDIVRYAGK